MMVELRWLKRHVETQDANGMLFNKPETVLQYRQQIMVPVGGWTQGTEPQRRPEWTNWQDVPTVTEGAE